VGSKALAMICGLTFGSKSYAGNSIAFRV